MLVLAEFDTRQGAKLLWQSEGSALNGVEQKMLPSGLHSRAADVVYFRHGDLHGTAVCLSDGNSRESYRLFSFAVLDKTLPWAQESFLRMSLQKFMALGDLKVLPHELGTPDRQCHPILSAPQFLKSWGPLVFEIWKAGLSRSRVLMHGKGSVAAGSRSAYLAAQISAIPADIQDLLPRRNEVPCFYNVTLSDLSTLRHAQSYIASTTDSVLTLPETNAADVIFDGDTVLNTTTGRRYSVTWRDKHRFADLAAALGADVPTSGLIDKLAGGLASASLWWASAGESALLNEESQPLLEGGPEGVALVGQFHKYTRNLVCEFTKLADASDNAVRVGLLDMASLGLDMFSAGDRLFLQRFSLAWHDRPVWFTSCSCLGP